MMDKAFLTAKRIYLVFCIAAGLLFVYLMLDFFVIPRDYSDQKPIEIVKSTEKPTEAAEPTAKPTAEPTEEPTAELTAEPTEVPTAKPTEVPTAEPTEVPTAKPTKTPGPTPSPKINIGSEYHDENVDIVLKQYREHSTEIYVADVKIKSILNLKAAFAYNKYGKNIIQTTSQQAKSQNAILAINGDFYGKREGGYVVRNGLGYRTNAASSRDRNSYTDLAILTDGSFRFIEENETSFEELAELSPWQVFSFGPALLENGEIQVKKGQDVGQSMASNPRTAIARVSNNHYYFVVSDGRTSESEGLSLLELAEFLKSLGAEDAYNLDGGGSTAMYFNGKIVNKPVNGGKITERFVSDIVYISP